jgi:DUF3048 family protein
MTPMRRRRIGALAAGAALVAVAVVLVLFLGGRSGGSNATGTPGGGSTPGTSPTSPPPPPICPLTGQVAKNGHVPDRPVLAVKVENLPAARPQTGLSWTDIVYEEPVEANITRFIALYQCTDAARVEPVRSARFTDADILSQFGHAAIAYSGGVPKVQERLDGAGLVVVSASKYPDAFSRDPAREAPHNLYTSTKELYRLVGDRAGGAPAPIFAYTDGTPRGKKTVGVHLPFSTYSDVYWRWDASAKRYLRWHGDVPHTYSDGTQVSATNVVVQVVDVKMTDVHDVNGVASPEVVATGGGTAYVFRGGRMVKGTWVRDATSDVTRFLDAKGREIKLLPGNTWVELFPSNLPLGVL